MNMPQGFEQNLKGYVDPERLGQIKAKGMAKGYLGVRDAALYLGLHPQTTLRRIKAKEISAFLIGRRWHISMENLDIYKMKIDRTTYHKVVPETAETTLEEGEQSLSSNSLDLGD